METILIPSKGRAGKSDLLLELNSNKEKNCFVFVEPQEYELYKKSYPEINIVALPQNNMGLSYSRNNIALFAESKPLNRYWLLDDDISFYYTEDTGKMKKQSYQCLEKAEEVILASKVDFAQASLEYRQFAWSNPDKVHRNTYCHCAVLIDVNKCIDIKCDLTLDLKIDQDFTIQLLNAGHESIRISRYAISSPKNASNAGGLQGTYHKEESNCYKMITKWGEDICQKIVKNDGRHDIVIHWRNIQKKQTSLF